MVKHHSVMIGFVADNLSGVAQTQYRINGGAWTTGTNFTLRIGGIYAIRFRSTDVAGNDESTKLTTVTVVITPPCKGEDVRLAPNSLFETVVIHSRPERKSHFCVLSAAIMNSFSIAS